VRRHFLPRFKIWPLKARYSSLDNHYQVHLNQTPTLSPWTGHGMTLPPLLANPHWERRPTFVYVAGRSKRSAKTLKVKTDGQVAEDARDSSCTANIQGARAANKLQNKESHQVLTPGSFLSPLTPPPTQTQNTALATTYKESHQVLSPGSFLSPLPLPPTPSRGIRHLYLCRRLMGILLRIFLNNCLSSCFGNGRYLQ